MGNDIPRPTGQTLAQHIHHGVRERIRMHELRMGMALREDEVAQWFAASRIPAREALRKLEQEGLVERQGRKYAVRRYSTEEILVTYRLREALEHYAVELAAGRVTAQQDAAMQALLEAQRDLPASRGAFSALDTAFHLKIVEIGGNASLHRELSLVLDRVTLIRGHEIDSDSGPHAAYADHCRIFDAVRRGDAGTARAELTFHYQSALRLHLQAERASREMGGHDRMTG